MKIKGRARQHPTPKTLKKQPLKVRLLRILFAYEPWARRGSAVRKVVSRIIVYVCCCLLIEAGWSHALGQAQPFPVVAVILSTLSVTFFSYALVYVPLQTSDTFHLVTRRVLATTLVSSVFVIMSFALLYRWLGLNGPAPKAALDYVYFSAVTFSTLGFGDFSPAETVGRLAAALQALLGNLHLAIIVATIFLRMSRRLPHQRK